MSTTQNPQFRERHYRVAELAELWAVSEDTVRRLFLAEPDIVRIHRPSRRTRSYKTIRIPESVAARVYQRLVNGGGGHGRF